MAAWLARNSARIGADPGLQPVHHQPQQSVLKRQAGQRQTACIRNISAPHRSQMTASSRAPAGRGAAGLRDIAVDGGAAVRAGFGGADMTRL